MTESASGLARRDLSPERRALFLAAQHCQGGHSEAGSAIAILLDVPFPLRMTELVLKLRAEGQNPATFYPWLIRAHGIVHGAERGRHPYFTDAELVKARAASSLGPQVASEGSREDHSTPPTIEIGEGKR